MKEKSDDARLEALDVVRDAIRKIYDAKRDGTATAKENVRLKELHDEWMAIMRKIGDEGELLAATDDAAETEMDCS